MPPVDCENLGNEVNVASEIDNNEEEEEQEDVVAMTMVVMELALIIMRFVIA